MPAGGRGRSDQPARSKGSWPGTASSTQSVRLAGQTSRLDAAAHQRRVRRQAGRSAFAAATRPSGRKRFDRVARLRRATSASWPACPIQSRPACWPRRGAVPAVRPGDAEHGRSSPVPFPRSPPRSTCSAAIAASGRRSTTARRWPGGCRSWLSPTAPNGASARFTKPDGDSGTLQVPAFPRDRPPRDTNRAGEAFAATLFDLLAEGWEPGLGSRGRAPGPPRDAPGLRGRRTRARPRRVRVSGERGDSRDRAPGQGLLNSASGSLARPC